MTDIRNTEDWAIQALEQDDRGYWKMELGYVRRELHALGYRAGSLHVSEANVWRLARLFFKDSPAGLVGAVFPTSASHKLFGRVMGELLGRASQRATIPEWVPWWLIEVLPGGLGRGADVKKCHGVLASRFVRLATGGLHYSHQWPYTVNAPCMLLPFEFADNKLCLAIPVTGRDLRLAPELGGDYFESIELQLLGGVAGDLVIERYRLPLLCPADFYEWIVEFASAVPTA